MAISTDIIDDCVRNLSEYNKRSFIDFCKTELAIDDIEYLRTCIDHTFDNENNFFEYCAPLHFVDELINVSDLCRNAQEHRFWKEFSSKWKSVLSRRVAIRKASCVDDYREYKRDYLVDDSLHSYSYEESIRGSDEVYCEPCKDAQCKSIW